MNSKAIINKKFQRIINVLLLNASFTDNLGLMHGKMGIAIYFYHLARETKNQIYEDYAGELLEQIFKRTHITTPIDFSYGLAGIGWGVEYLIKTGFIKAGEDNILEDYDTAIFQLDKKIPQLPREYNNFYGYGLYFLSRAKNGVVNEEALSLILNDLKRMFTEILNDDVKPSPNYIISLIYFIQEIRKRKYCPADVDELTAEIPRFVTKYSESDFNIIEHHYLKLLLENLNIASCLSNKINIVESEQKEQMKLYVQAIFYSIVFPEIIQVSGYIADNKPLIMAIFEEEEIWKELLLKTKNFDFGLENGLTAFAYANFY